jgi:hypothetical protein
MMQNPFNGIERPEKWVKMKLTEYIENPFNGIERPHQPQQQHQKGSLGDS